MSADTRRQFAAQCRTAALRSAWTRDHPIDVALVRWPERTLVSVVGASISRAVYDLWPMRGARLRVVRVYLNGKPTR